MLSYTSDFVYIDLALKARWEPFQSLALEFKNFTPKAISDFSEFRKQEVFRLQKINSDKSEIEIQEFVDRQIALQADPEMQVALKFQQRIMAEYVTVAFLSHALSEAIINGILAIGLANIGSEDLFILIERGDIGKKWTIGPKSFSASYTLPKNEALYHTLQHLINQRNAFVHYKIELEIDGKKMLTGSKLDRAPLAQQIIWINRFFSLPYDLLAHAKINLPDLAYSFFIDRGTIQPYQAHRQP